MPNTRVVIPSALLIQQVPRDDSREEGTRTFRFGIVILSLDHGLAIKIVVTNDTEIIVAVVAKVAALIPDCSDLSFAISDS